MTNRHTTITNWELSRPVIPSPMAAPVIDASMRVIFKKCGARGITPSISKHEGTKHISTAGRPFFFRTDISSKSPARIRIIIKAIFRSSADISEILPSIKAYTYGPAIIPTASIPMSESK